MGGYLLNNLLYYQVAPTRSFGHKGKRYYFLLLILADMCLLFQNCSTPYLVLCLYIGTLYRMC